jgi:DNA-binding response OmpR family regulator
MNQDQELPSLVVIIDDVPGLRKAVSGLLEMENIKCQEFADGGSAKAWLSDNHQSVSVCLLDSSLGTSSVSGFELLKYIREIDVDLPVLFYSGREENHAKASLEAGATLYVRKPFDPYSLIVMVRTLDRMSTLSKQMAVTWADRDTLQRCIDAMGAEVMLLDHENGVLLVNKRKADTIAEPMEKVLGSKCWTFACPNDGPCAGCQMIKNESPNYRATYVNEIEIGSRSLCLCFIHIWVQGV